MAGREGHQRESAALSCRQSWSAEGLPDPEPLGPWLGSLSQHLPILAPGLQKRCSGLGHRGTRDSPGSRLLGAVTIRGRLGVRSGEWRILSEVA